MCKIIGADPYVTPDDRDRELLAQRATRRAEVNAPRSGDYVVFTDGVKRRISSLWDGNVQTSDGGSWYLLTSGDASFSGSLHPPVRREFLTDSRETEPASFWFFHHDLAQAHNAVHVELRVRVWTASTTAP